MLPVELVAYLVLVVVEVVVAVVVLVNVLVVDVDVVLVVVSTIAMIAAANSMCVVGDGRAMMKAKMMEETAKGGPDMKHGVDAAPPSMIPLKLAQ